MWTCVQSTVLVFVTMAGLLSGIVCQSHMLGEAGSATEPVQHVHAHHSEAATPFDHGSGHERPAPEDPCCVIQTADAKTLNAIVLLPEALEAAMFANVGAPALERLNANLALLHAPPGRCSLLHQTCALLI